jgi:hypothetical protein
MAEIRNWPIILYGSLPYRTAAKKKTCKTVNGANNNIHLWILVK